MRTKITFNKDEPVMPDSPETPFLVTVDGKGVYRGATVREARDFSSWIETGWKNGFLRFDEKSLLDPLSVMFRNRIK